MTELTSVWPPAGLTFDAMIIEPYDPDDSSADDEDEQEGGVSLLIDSDEDEGFIEYHDDDGNGDDDARIASDVEMDFDMDISLASFEHHTFQPYGPFHESPLQQDLDTTVAAVLQLPATHGQAPNLLPPPAQAPAHIPPHQPPTAFLPGSAPGAPPADPPGFWLPDNEPSYPPDILNPYIQDPGHPMNNSIDADFRNLNCLEFLLDWSRRRSSRRTIVPRREVIHELTGMKPGTVTRMDLCGDSYDIQGMDWTTLGVTRAMARVRRHESYLNHVAYQHSDQWLPHFDDKRLPWREDYLRFRKWKPLADSQLSHFQLRNLLTCPSRSQAIYSAHTGLRCLNLTTGSSKAVIKLDHGFAFSTLTSGFGLVAGGTLNGQYCIKRLDAASRDRHVEGEVTRNPHAIANHIEIYSSRRSGGPCLAMSSNDSIFRVMDIQTEQTLLERKYDYPMNCTAISKDNRLRAMVGDGTDVAIVDADSGNNIIKLSGHRDFGFACAWSDNGWNLATGNQDKGVRIWDARKWTDSNMNGTPVCSIWSEMSGVRALRFSPLGSGKPILVATEEADFINVIDARDFGSKQTFDMFGQIGGVDFADDGNQLNVFCADTLRGGILQLERCGLEAEPVYRKREHLPVSFPEMISGGADKARRPRSSRLPDFVDGLYKHDRKFLEPLGLF